MMKSVSLLAFSQLIPAYLSNSNNCHYEFDHKTVNKKLEINYKRESWYKNIKMIDGGNFLDYSKQHEICPESCPLSDIHGIDCLGCYSSYPFADPSNTINPSPVNITKWFSENVVDFEKWTEPTKNGEPRLGCCCGDCHMYEAKYSTNDDGKQNRCSNGESIDSRKARCSKTELWADKEGKKATHDYYQGCFKLIGCFKDVKYLYDRYTQTDYDNEDKACLKTDNKGTEFSIGTIVAAVVCAVLVLGGLFFLAYYFIKDKHQPTQGIADTEILR